MILVALESMFLKDTDSVTTADSKMPPSECGLDNTGTIFPPLDHPSGSSVVQRSASAKFFSVHILQKNMR